MSQGIGTTGYGFALSWALPTSAVAGLCMLSPPSPTALSVLLKIEEERKMLFCSESTCVDEGKDLLPHASWEASEIA